MDDPSLVDYAYVRSEDLLRIQGQNQLSDPSVTKVSVQELDDRLAILQQTMAIAPTNIPEDWRTANPGKTYGDWLNEIIGNLTLLVNNKVNSADFNTQVQPFISQWLTTYINANPNTWVNIRTVLQYYPLTYTFFNFPPTKEWLPRAEYMVPNANAPDAISQWKDTSNSANYMYFGNNSSEWGFLRPATTGVPVGFLKINAARFFMQNIFWPNKGTFFMVYSWTTAPNPSILINASHAAGTARMLLTRTNFQVIAESTMTFNGPNTPDTELDTPYIVGMSWDYTISPPRTLWITHNRAIEHIGPNEPTEVLELDNPLGLVGTPTTSMNLPYSPMMASTARGTNNVTLFGTKTALAGGNECKVHYFGQWTDLRMTMDQARTVHLRLMERYCTPPFDGPIRGLSE